MPPFGVPVVVSAAFWGGVWGIPLAFVLARFRGLGYWAAGLLFGALVVTSGAWFVVAPLKGLPLGFDFGAARVVLGLTVNGAWGLGTALLLRLAPGARPAPA